MFTAAPQYCNIWCIRSPEHMYLGWCMRVHWLLQSVATRKWPKRLQSDPSSSLFFSAARLYLQGFANGMKGPVDSPPCNTSIQAEDRTHEIYQTGVVSTNNEYLITGTSDNQLSVVDVDTLQTYTIGILSDGGPDGIVVSPESNFHSMVHSACSLVSGCPPTASATTTSLIPRTENIKFRLVATMPS